MPQLGVRLNVVNNSHLLNNISCSNFWRETTTIHNNKLLHVHMNSKEDVTWDHINRIEDFRTCQSAPETWEGSAHCPPPWRARASKWFAADLRGSNSSHRPLLERLFHQLPHSWWWLSECGRRWGASAVLPISMPPRHPLRSVAWRSERTHFPAENHSRELLKDPSSPLLHAQESPPWIHPSFDLIIHAICTHQVPNGFLECLEKSSLFRRHSNPIIPSSFTSSTSRGCLHCSTAGLDSLKGQAAGD